jgi:hypothetical protein
MTSLRPLKEPNTSEPPFPSFTSHPFFCFENLFNIKYIYHDKGILCSVLVHKIPNAPSGKVVDSPNTLPLYFHSCILVLSQFLKALKKKKKKKRTLQN